MGSNWLKKSSQSKLMSNFLAFKFVGLPCDLPRNRFPKLSFAADSVSFLLLLSLYSDFLDTDTFLFIVNYSFLGNVCFNPEKSKMSDSSTNALGFLTGSGFFS